MVSKKTMSIDQINKLIADISEYHLEQKDNGEIVLVQNTETVLEELKNKCYEKLDFLLNNGFDQKIMDSICQPICSRDALFEQKAFKYPAKLITNLNELAKFISNLNDDEIENIEDAIRIMESKPKHIDVFKDEFWIYQDRVNWEIHIDSDESIIAYIREVIEWCDEEEIDTVKNLYHALRWAPVTTRCIKR